MKGSKKKTILLLFTVFIVIAFFKIDAYAAPNSVNIPQVNVSIGMATIHHKIMCRV